MFLFGLCSIQILAWVQGLCHNPPVTIDEWPNIDTGTVSEVSDTCDELVDGSNHDPIFHE